MTDQLHDLMTRIADRAGPGPNDPTLWARARRARRDQRRIRAGAVAALVAAVLAGLTLAGVEQSQRSAPPPVEQPDRHDGPGIPATIYGVAGDGGLALESDLAVGQVSVALSNATDAFVVTAEDGAYHRLRLPGFHPEEFRAELAGLALSPDGRHLAWSWRRVHGPSAGEGIGGWGVRVADLTTGTVRVTEVMTEGNGLHSNLRWSPDSRYLVMERVFSVDTGASLPPQSGGYAVERFGVVMDTRRMRVTTMFGSYEDGNLLDPWAVSSAGRAYRVVQDRLLTWDVDRGQTVGRRSMIAQGVSGLSTGRFSADGRWLLLAGRDLSVGLALVDVERSDPVPATLARTGSEVDLLGWTDDRRVLAVLGSGRGTPDDRELVRLTIVPAPFELAAGGTGPVRLDVEVLGQVVGASDDTTVSVAADLAAGERTTWDTDAPPFVDKSPQRAGSSEATGSSASTPPDERGPSVPASLILLGAGGAAAAAVILAGARRKRGARSGTSR